MNFFLCESTYLQKLFTTFGSSIIVTLTHNQLSNFIRDDLYICHSLWLEGGKHFCRREISHIIMLMTSCDKQKQITKARVDLSKEILS